MESNSINKEELIHNMTDNLPMLRTRLGLTQEELAEKSGVSPNTIRAYERKSKDLNKAQFDTIIRLARVLKCEAEELFD